MLKKVILFAATFAIVAIAYTIYQWREAPLPQAAPRRVSAPMPVAVSRPATSGQTFSFRDAQIPPGESPKVTVLDDKGNAKIIFQSTHWRAVRDNAFRVTDPTARLLLPAGQLAYVWADEGEVELQRGEGNNYNPKRGWLRGNVLIVIDRSKPEWREANPDLLEPEQHPEMIVKIWMDDVDFDLDMGRLESRGPILVQSPDGNLEGQGLELIWNEATRQVRKLRIARGQRAAVRTAGNVEFGVGVKEVVQESPNGETAEDEEPEAITELGKPQAAASKPVHEDVHVTGGAVAEGAKRPDQLTFQRPGAGTRLKEDRVDTYQIEFHENVTAEQRDGVKVSGRLQGAKLLRLIAELGREERANIEHPQTRPAAARAEGKRGPDRMKPAGGVLAGASQNFLEVRWTGELIAMPLASSAAESRPAEAAMQRGATSRPGGERALTAKAPRRAQRMHLLAVGSPVEIFDQRSGSVRCLELEYHAETKQVWLRGTHAEPVSLSTGPTRQFWGENIFVDRQFGVARVDGAGRMVDRRERKEKTLPPCISEPDRKLAEDEEGLRGAEITWTGGVQLQFGVASEETEKPGGNRLAKPQAAEDGALAQAGVATEVVGAPPGPRSAAKRDNRSPLGFLQNAVFQGQVVMTQQDESIRADRIEAHFLPPATKDLKSEVSDQKSEDQSSAGELASGNAPDRADEASERVDSAEPAEAGETAGTDGTAKAASGSIADSDSIVAERLTAIGNVRLSRGQQMDGTQAADRPDVEKHGLGRRQAVIDDVTCDRLEVEMTVDDVGRNVPQRGRAIGHVFAKRITGSTQRDIRATDELVLTLTSVPRPITPEEQERLQAAARRCGKDADSPEWQAFEAKLRNRRRIVATHLDATGAVEVHMRNPDNPKRNLDLAADSLRCALRADEEITQALVVGSEEQPATVDMGEVYVKGPQVALNMDTQSLEVPGAGRMRLVSKQDLTGRASDKPVPVVINWQRRMAFRGQENVANFSGDVRAVGNATTLDCSELRVEFEDVVAAAQAATADAPWVLKPIFGAFRGGQKDESPAGRMAQRLRKRPTYMRATGDVVIVSTDYAKAAEEFAPGQLLMSLLPGRLSGASTQPAEERGPMLSRFRVAGPMVGVNLVEEHFVVEGAGNLLLEDFRLPDERAARPSQAAVGVNALIDAPSAGLDNAGPSQTLFRWQNSMSFLNQRNVAVFDRQVVMDHVSGSKMVLWEQLAATMKVDPVKLGKLKSRQAHVTCDNLLVEFIRTTPAGQGRPPLAGGMRVKNLQSTGNVLMEMDDGKQTVTGTLITYREDTGEVRVTGSGQVPAHVMMQDERSGILRTYRAEPGEPIEWNQRTGRVHIKGGNILSTGK